MTRPDIILREKRISVYNGENGSEDGSDLELVSSDEPGTAADIKMNTDLANIEAGGGESDRSEGDLKLNDTDDDVRVQITAQTGGRDDSSTDRVWINGGEAAIEVGGDGHGGEVRVGEERGDPRITLTAESGGRDEYSPSRIWIDGANERVAVGGSSDVVVSGRRDGDAGVAGEILVGGDSPALAGELIRHPVSIFSKDTSPPSGGNDYLAGVIQLRDGGSQSAQLRGDRASLSLGYAEWNEKDREDIVTDPIEAGITPSGGVNGSIRLHDGKFWVATIAAENGTLKFSGRGSSEPFLVADPGEQEIRLADGWTLDASNIDGG